MFKKKEIKGLVCLLAIMLASTGWGAVGKKTAESEQSAEVKAIVEKAGTPNTTEVEALGPTRAVSSIMQGLGKVGNKHKVLFIEVLEENYDTFLPGLGVTRRWVSPYFKFDKEKKKMIVDSGILWSYSLDMLNAQGKIKEDVSLVVKHTLEYKGIGRNYPRYYIYEVSRLPVVINLIGLKLLYEEQIRPVTNLKMINLFSNGEVEFSYGEERTRLKPGESWKDKKRSKIVFIKSDEYIKNKFDWFNRVIGIDKTIEWLKKTRSFKKSVSEGDLEALKIGKVIFLTEVTIFNHGIVEVEVYNRGGGR
jgi:hypothetical protein